MPPISKLRPFGKAHFKVSILIAGASSDIVKVSLMKSWLEQRIRRYEHMRWAQEPNRRMLPFSWGLEHIGGDPNDPDPTGFLNRFVEATLAASDEWFASTAADDYKTAQ